MTIQLSEINWVITTSVVNEAVAAEHPHIRPIGSGMEATVYEIRAENEKLHLTLKHWDKRPPTDARLQYELLEKLCALGLPVSTPYGLGRNAQGEDMLLTSYNGQPLPLEGSAPERMEALARLLIQIHNVPLRKLGHAVGGVEFVPYFFPMTAEHSDLLQVLKELLAQLEIQATSFIHGDFNLGNVLLHHGHSYTVIDWTNAQIGDRRYDFAWASFLIRIYNGEACYRAFADSYLNRLPIEPNDVTLFEMLACIRWIWLSRIAPIPVFAHTVEYVQRFIARNNLLQSIQLRSLSRNEEREI